MGACLSSPSTGEQPGSATAAAAAAPGAPRAASSPSGQPDGACADGPASSCAEQVSPGQGGASPRGRSSIRSSREGANVIKLVKGLLSDLGDIPADGTTATCAQAAGVLLQHVAAADLVSIASCTRCRNTCILVAAVGAGEQLLQQQPVMRGSCWAPVAASSGGSAVAGATSCSAGRGWGASSGSISTEQRASSSPAAGSGAGSGRASDEQQQPHLYYTDSRPELEAQLPAGMPKDWALLQSGAGLRSFFALPLRAKDGNPVAVISLASRQPGAFQEEWFDTVLSMACSALLQLLNSHQLVGLVELVGQLHCQAAAAAAAAAGGGRGLTAEHGQKEARDMAAFMLLGVQQLLLAATNIDYGVRVGLVDGSTGGPASLLLMCRPQPTRRASMDASATGGSGHSHHQQQPLLHMRRIPAQGTLLDEALMAEAPSFCIADTTTYLQSHVAAKDLFVGPQDAASSLLLVPFSSQFLLQHSHGSLAAAMTCSGKDISSSGSYGGGLYLTHTAPTEFAAARAAAASIAELLQHVVVDVVLQQGLVGAEQPPPAAAAAGGAAGGAAVAAAAGVWTPEQQVEPPVTPPAAAENSSGSSSSPPRLGSSTALAASSAAASAASAAGAGGSCSGAAPATGGSSANNNSVGGGSGRNQMQFKSPGNLSWTGNMVQLLQQQVQVRAKSGRGHRAVLQPDSRRPPWNDDLRLHGVLGSGGFGRVYAGTWKGSPAAVKVMYVPQEQRTLMKNAMEMAVMQTLSHPNVVRVYSCLTDMVEEAECPLGGMGGMASRSSSDLDVHSCNPAQLRYRSITEAEDSTASAPFTCNIVVMELCDKGSLRRVINKGLLHRVAADGSRLVPHMHVLLTVLLEIARSIQYIHSMGLIHCDIKPENILLRSSADSPLGYACKLCDFGMVKLLADEKMYLRNQSASGTITYLAPERFVANTRVTAAVDIYALGVLMYELYTGQPPFAAMHAANVVALVASGARPQFPPDTPPSFLQLAAACMAQDAAHRPQIDLIVHKLMEMLVMANRIYLASLQLGSDVTAAPAMTAAPAAAPAPAAAAAPAAPPQAAAQLPPLPPPAAAVPAPRLCPDIRQQALLCPVLPRPAMAD